MPISACSHALGGTRSSGDVVLPLEAGLGLSHLLLDLVQEEGVLLTLGVALHGGQPRSSIARPCLPAGCSPWQCLVQSPELASKGPSGSSPGRVIYNV